MPINTGYIEGTKLDGALRIRIYYDATADPSGPQALINGPRGFCLDVTNTTGKNQKVDVTLPGGTSQTFTFGQGDPVTTGAAKSLTVKQVNALGFANRSDVAGFALSD